MIHSLCLFPQSHMVSASVFFQFIIFDLQRPIPVLCLFRYFQSNHGASDHGPRSSDGMDLSFCGTDRRWWVHALSHSAGAFLSSGVTECTKLFLDFRRLFTCSWLYRECLGSSVCSLFSSFLSRYGSPSDTRWCNTSKEIYILNRCSSQTSCYGPATHRYECY